MQPISYFIYTYIEMMSESVYLWFLSKSSIFALSLLYSIDQFVCISQVEYKSNSSILQIKWYYVCELKGEILH